MASDNVKFGFVEFAEKWNGRMAMLGFTIEVLSQLPGGSSYSSPMRPLSNHRSVTESNLISLPIGNQDQGLRH
eukprot:g6775.t1